ncbi:HAD family hydrolase [Rufibacter immobilis]|uniref:HAD family hydrolase n=1 Tax=Rufibacter immobilis TaxID=1348778 RepID=UPI0035F0765C
MTISFDLDDTLISGTKRFPTQQQNLFQRVLGIEKIRQGTVPLMKRLKAEGHQVFIYTTSFHSASYIRWMFLTYGIWLDGIINQRRHDRTLAAEANNFSKYPPAFGIDLHVDDSKGVEMEGQRFGFLTLVVSEEEKQWQERVIMHVNQNAALLSQDL